MAILPKLAPLLLNVASPSIQLFLWPNAIAAPVVAVLMNPVLLPLGLDIRLYAAASALDGRLLLPIAFISRVLDEASSVTQVLMSGVRPAGLFLGITLALQVRTLPKLTVRFVRGAKAV